jgi:hypothetical protein
VHSGRREVDSGHHRSHITYIAQPAVEVLPMSTVDHIEALKAKHASLEHAIDEENSRPHPDDDAICSLKKRKLLIKDEITRLSSEDARPH